MAKADMDRMMGRNQNPDSTNQEQVEVTLKIGWFKRWQQKRVAKREAKLISKAEVKSKKDAVKEAKRIAKEEAKANKIAAKAAKLIDKEEKEKKKVKPVELNLEPIDSTTNWFNGWWKNYRKVAVLWAVLVISFIFVIFCLSSSRDSELGLLQEWDNTLMISDSLIIKKDSALKAVIIDTTKRNSFIGSAINPLIYKHKPEKVWSASNLIGFVVSTLTFFTVGGLLIFSNLSKKEQRL